MHKNETQLWLFSCTRALFSRRGGAATFSCAANACVNSIYDDVNFSNRIANRWIEMERIKTCIMEHFRLEKFSSSELYRLIFALVLADITAEVN